MSLLILVVLLFAAPAERSRIPLGLDAYRPVPETNPLTPEKIALGRRLFFDRRLSRDGSIACATCHDPRHAFADGRAVAVGIEGRKGTRNVPTLINRVYGKSYFLDGRAPTLELQAVGPILNPIEMDMTMRDLLTRLRKDARYAVRFRSVFHRDVNQEDLAAALASYVRTILSGGSRLDRYMNGDVSALPAPAKLGLNVFRGKARCVACHAGPNLTDESFHNTGLAWRNGELLDPGRFAISNRPEDRGAFKTPTLREVSRTAPYMHDGSVATLEDVVDYYDRGGNPNPGLDPELRPLRLTAEQKQALVAFLRSLSGTIKQAR